MSFDPGPPSFPTRCCSPFLPSSPLPPLAFSFTFYAPISTPTASYFYSEEPLKRTKIGIVELDERIWGGKEKEEGEKVEKFIRDAIGSGGREAREGIIVKGRASRRMDESGRDSGRKRKREESETRSIREDEGEGRYDKKIRSEKVEDEEYGSEGGARIDVERPTRRNSRPSPSYELVPTAEPSFPFRRVIDTPVSSIYKHLSPFEIDSFLTPTPMPSTHSHKFYTNILDFLAFLESPSIWETHRGLSIFRHNPESRQRRIIRNQSPNFALIRQRFPLHSRGKDHSYLQDSVYGNTGVSVAVIKWIWGHTPTLEELRWVVENSPLPLFALFLEYVPILRFIQGAKHSRARFRHYLSTSPGLSARCERSKILIDWLDAPRDERRWELMFDYGDGERGEKKWDWWFQLDQERTIEELDEWENQRACEEVKR